MDHTAEILKAKYHQQPKLNVHDISQWFNTATPIDQAITIQDWFSDNRHLLNTLPDDVRITVDQAAKDRFASAMRERVNKPDPFLTIRSKGA
ncbi:hypothetical protein K5Q02_11375 [Pseudomonas sp. MM211]|uniref:hypothetical protein n=1 Tax=Pseudomonas sp. MM211 TaxID=2866808 RepID=UPI001CEC89AA|nr:hypothetical protein [Pseudomonas sp. MM211]UCJ18917.1 hypothetical protein K5Q02_11375 [Pseudomonas sp. MM211]